MNLFAERNSWIDTENAFKIGPHIVRVEQQKGAVIKLNLGEPDFSVPKHIKIPPSLKNIYKELNQDDEVDFTIPTHGDLENWSKQGVLLLNCALTVRQKSPLSHMKYWKNYTDCIIRYISDNCKDVIFLLWGSFSKSKKKIINLENHHILESHHPSPLSANRGGWFGCKHFSKTNKILDSLGKSEIDWNL